jgi:hypothetical protein
MHRLVTLMRIMTGTMLLVFVSGGVVVARAADQAVKPGVQGQKAPVQGQGKAALQGGGGGGGGLGYTCSDTIEGGRKCTCDGAADCERLKQSRECCVPQPGGGCVTIMECPHAGTGCSCEWAKKKGAIKGNKAQLNRAPVQAPVAK